VTRRSLVVATRKSQLALAQARAWVDELMSAHPGLSVSELHVTTTGDRVQDRALAAIGGKGLFIKEVEEAIVARRADLAVHSMKDVPAELAPSLVIGCVPRREDPRDVLVTREGGGLDDLPQGSRVGTSSLRRQVQLQDRRPDLVHAETAVAVAAERGVMVAVEGSCQIPVAAYAVRDQDQLWLRGMLAEADGSRLRRRELRLAWPERETEAHQAGLELGRELRHAK
jgi:porphobilinogen deaminase